MSASRHLTKTAVHGLPKHERLDDLLGASSDPAPRRTRRIAWVGEPSPFDDPAVAYLMTTGRLPPAVRRGIRLAAARANTRNGHRRRLLEHPHPLSLAPVPGLGRSYAWTPANGYLQDVDLRVCALFDGPVAGAGLPGNVTLVVRPVDRTAAVGSDEHPAATFVVRRLRAEFLRRAA